MKNLVLNFKKSLRNEDTKMYLIVSGVYFSVLVFLISLSVAAVKIATIYGK